MKSNAPSGAFCSGSSPCSQVYHTRAMSGGREELIYEAREWVKSNVVVECSKEGHILEVHVATVLREMAATVFGILNMGEEVWRGIKACVKRKILENDGEGNFLLEVHNKSEWHVLGLARGSVVSKLLVETSLRRNLMHFGLVPGSSPLLSDMYGIWRCYDLSSNELREFLELDEGHPAMCENNAISGSLVTLYQRFEFSSIPSMLHGAVSRAAVGQIRCSLEDLVIAVWRLRRGSLNLPPLMAVIMKEIDREQDGVRDGARDGARDGEKSRGSPLSVDSVSAKSLLEEKARAFVGKASTTVNGQVTSMLREELDAYCEGRATAADRQADAKDEPSSHPLTRMESLEFLTRIGSTKSLASLVEMEATSLAMQRPVELDGAEQTNTGLERPPRGFFRRVKSLIDSYMGAEIEDGECAEYNEFDDLEEGWFVVA